MLYASTHEMPLYPGTGARAERGEHDQIVNAPLSAGDGGEVFREAMEAAILPRVEAFAPDLIIISAGFDAHYRDPLGNLQLQRGGFRLGDAGADEARRQALRRPRRLAAGGRLRPAGAVALGRRACHGVNGELSEVTNFLRIRSETFFIFRPQISA